MKSILFRFVVATIAMVALLTVAGLPAAAQGPAATPRTHSETVCDLYATTPPRYVDCGLWFDHGRLRRGAKGDLVGRERFAPIPLRSMVIGDSAQAYAFRYEQDRWIALPFQGSSMIALAASLILERHRCQPVGCSNASSYHAAKIAFITGASLGFISVPFISSSRRAGDRATWWHNAGLSTLGH